MQNQIQMLSRHVFYNMPIQISSYPIIHELSEFVSPLLLHKMLRKGSQDMQTVKTKNQHNY